MSANLKTNNVNNTKKSSAGGKINAYQICLVALAVGINIAGGQIALLLKLACLSGQHWYDSDRCTSGTMVWNASKSDQRNLHGNDS